MNPTRKTTDAPTAFQPDVKALRAQARAHIEAGAVTPGYGARREEVCAVLNSALATELVCVLRYRRHHFMAEGIASESVKAEFLAHSNEEQGHADRLAARIVQLGGEPDFNPEGLSARSHAEYVAGSSLREMIKEDLVAERVAIESYRGAITWLSNHDSTTRLVLEEILAVEEEHADDMASLLKGLAD